MHTEIHVLSIVRDKIRGVIKVCSRQEAIFERQTIQNNVLKQQTKQSV